MKQRNISFSLLVLLIIGVLIPAFAAALPLGSTVSLSFTGVSPGKAVSTTTTGPGSYGSAWVGAGVYNLELGSENTPYDSFCIDFFQYAPSSTHDYLVEDVADVFNSAIKDDIYELWDENYSEAMGAIEAAALQVALWEVTTSFTNYTSDSYDVFDGGFSLNNDNYGIGTLANSYLNNLGDGYDPSLSLYTLTNPDKQDYLVAGAPVPEPSTLLLMGAGLLGVVAYRRRKQVK